MSSTPLPPAHKNLSISTNPAVFLDLSVAKTTATTIHSQQNSMQKDASRVVLELYSNLYPTLIATICKFFTGEAIQNNKPAGFHSQRVQQLVHNQFITFTLVGQGFNCVEQAQRASEYATVALSQLSLETTTDSVNPTTTIPILSIPSIAQWTVTIPIQRLKLGNLFEMRLYFGSPQIPSVSATSTALAAPTASTDLNELVIGRIIATGDIFQTINTLKVNTTSFEPITPIIAIQSGEL